MKNKNAVLKKENEMSRIIFIVTLYVFSLSSPFLCLSQSNSDQQPLDSNRFGTEFKWGAACAAFQVEGAWYADG